VLPFRVPVFNLSVETIFYPPENKKKEDKLRDKGWGAFPHGESKQYKDAGDLGPGDLCSLW
jgi:hypothetical protein